MKTNRLNRTVLLPALAALLGAGGAFATHDRAQPRNETLQTLWEHNPASSPSPCNEITCDVDGAVACQQSFEIYDNPDCEGENVDVSGLFRQ